MFSALSSIVILEVLLKIGDWAIEIFKVIAGKKDKGEEEDRSGPISITIINDNSPAIPEPVATQPTEPQNVVLPKLPQGNEPKGKPSQGVVLPLPPPEQIPTEPDFGTDEYLTQLLTAIYKNQRSDEEVGIGLGSTDELNPKREQ